MRLRRHRFRRTVEMHGRQIIKSGLQILSRQTVSDEPQPVFFGHKDLVAALEIAAGTIGCP
ncbi:hypothetical protein A5675_21655 [Mycobacterium malmoense]|nr:hypothetical protein A5675_21655 [Mycobacterium malmoense]